MKFEKVENLKGHSMTKPLETAWARHGDEHTMKRNGLHRQTQEGQSPTMKPTNAIEDASHSTPLLEGIAVENLIEQRLSHGMLVFAPPMRLLHINEAAWELIRELSEAGTGPGNGQPKAAKGLLPTVLRTVCAEIFESLRHRPQGKDWEGLEIKCLIGPAHRPVLVRGFGVPDDKRGEHARVVLVLEGVGRRKAEFSHNMTQRYPFTEREYGVLECLARGWTNKEIASALSVALPTVKEHVRHIMEKTKTNTRTGILMQVFHA